MLFFFGNCIIKSFEITGAISGIFKSDFSKKNLKSFPTDSNDIFRNLLKSEIILSRDFDVF